jgi:hypothetical protein
MIRAIAVALVLTVTPAVASAQAPRTTPAQQPEPAVPEIKLDEATTLRAAALEARMSALLANFALLQRQAQDMQQEMTKMLEERKKLIEDAGKKAKVDIKEPMEWAFDNKGQRYVRVRKTQ